MILSKQNYACAERAFLPARSEIRKRTPMYEGYFEWLRPRSLEDVFQRGLCQWFVHII